ncbi:MAG: MopE-related protein, partial [Myxococcota bacterium]
AAGGDDCDDEDPDQFPGADERCDGQDQDCDGAVDEDPTDPPAWVPDLDHDGFGDRTATPALACEGPVGWIADRTDCDDADAAISPDATEIWYDGVDQDCDDGDDFDRDGDGWSSDTYGGADCDDGHATTAPDAAEIWYDGVDQNCDGNDDDQDGDGVPGGTAAEDCDDLVPTTYPGSVEVDDDVDQDCDGWIDEGLWAAGVLVVSELQLDPTAVADADGRYAELYNPTTGHVDLSGVTLTIGGVGQGLSAGFLGPGEARLVCTDVDPASNGGIPGCDDVVGWPADADELELEGGGWTLDQVSWATFSVPTGASLELASDQLDAALNDAPRAWCTATAAYGDGDLGTPGVVANPCP